MLQRIKDKTRLKTVISVIPTILFLFFLYYMMIKTYTGTVKSTVEGTEVSLKGFTTLSESFEEVLQNNFFDKNNYIDLNGLTTKILGINSLNERQLLANGHLTDFGNASDTTKYSDSVIELNEFLSDRDIDFVYLLAPSKRAFYGAEFAPGYSSTAWQNIDSMIDALDEAGVNTIDMDAWFEENGWDMDDVYFKTDHHWLPQAGLAAAGVTMELLSDEGIAEYQEDLLDPDSYTITTLEDWFLGSHGKRVGIYYAGVDDIDVYIPNFETDYAYSGLSSGTTNWKYTDSPLNLSYTENKNYYGSDPHCIYLYGDNPLQLVTNSEAVNDKRVLITGDSFRRTWEYFLTTQFTEVYSVDLRHYTDGTFAEFVEEIQPDIVIMCTNSTNSDQLYGFGVEEYMTALEATSEDDIADVISLGDVFIEAQEENSSNFIVLYADLEPNQSYTLTLDSTDYVGGEELYVQMTLQNLSTNKAIYNRYFDVNSDETQKWIFTTPDDVSGVYVIYLYAGTKGHTKGVSVEVTGIELRKGIYEE